jgi:hypothetical protein
LAGIMGVGKSSPRGNLRITASECRDIWTDLLAVRNSPVQRA